MNQIVRLDTEKHIKIIPGGRGFIETVNTPKISENDVHRLWEIEQDMWAHGLGEYVKCSSCGNIDGKYDTYLESILGKGLIKKTVSEIETALGNKTICCTKCQSESDAIFSAEYQNEIVSRHSFSTSFLSVHRDIRGKIHGFMDGYVADFGTIYEREFSHYYEHIGVEVIKSKIEGILQKEMPKELLCITALGTTQENANMYIIYELMKAFFDTALRYNPNITGIYESVLGTNTHGIYDVCGGERIHTIQNENAILTTHQGVVSDIFIHQNMPLITSQNLGSGLRDFLKNHGRGIKEIVENHA